MSFHLETYSLVFFCCGWFRSDVALADWDYVGEFGLSFAHFYEPLARALDCAVSDDDLSVYYQVDLVSANIVEDNSRHESGLSKKDLLST